MDIKTSQKLVVLGTFFVLVASVAGQTYREPVRLSSDVTVYTAPPSFSTGQGWTLSAVKTTSLGRTT